MIFDLLNQIGGCVLYHDYRSGSYRDWSGNGNNGTPTGAGLTRGGADFHAQSDLITVPFSSELDVGNGDGMAMIVLVPDYLAVNTGTTRRLYEQVGGIACYLDVTNNLIVFIVDNAPSTRIGISPTSDSSKCFGVSWADGDAPELFLDGVYHADFAAALSKGTGTADIGIGNRIAAGRTLGQTMSAIALFNKALTATEHAELYGALAAARWPTKVYSHARPDLAIDRDEAGIVAGYDMRPVAGKVFDASGNGNDGTVVKAVASSDGLEFNGIDSYVTVPDAPSLDLTTTMTISAWVKTAVDGVVAAKWTISPANRSYALVVDTALKLWLSSDGTGFEAEIGTIDVRDNRWHHIVAVLSGGTVSFYVNGVFDRSQSFSGQTSAFVGTSDLRFGDETSGTIGSMFNGTIKNAQIFNVAKDQTWVTAEYAKGAKAGFRTNWGARETSVNVTTGPISNTPFEVISGSFKVVTDTINGTPVKALECVTAGVVAMPSSYFKQGEGDAARGTFEWWMYRALLGNLSEIAFIGSQKSAPTAAGFNGYRIAATSSTLYLARLTNGGSATFQISAAGQCSHLVWHRHTFTVSTGGVFTNYIDGSLVDVTGGTGTNPATDATYTTSKFFVAQVDAGDKIALGAVDGSYGITKRLGVNTDGL